MTRWALSASSSCASVITGWEVVSFATSVIFSASPHWSSVTVTCSRMNEDTVGSFPSVSVVSGTFIRL